MTNWMLAAFRRDALAEIDKSAPTWTAVTEWHAGTRPILLRAFPDQAEYFDQFLNVKWTRSPRIYSLDGGPSNHASAAAASDKRHNDAKIKNTND